MKQEELEEIRKQLCQEIFGKDNVTEEDLTLSAQLVEELSIGYTQSEFVRNPYSGEGIILDPVAVAIYDYLKGCEMANYLIGITQAKDWFRINRFRAYRVLVD